MVINDNLAKFFNDYEIKDKEISNLKIYYEIFKVIFNYRSIELKNLVKELEEFKETLDLILINGEINTANFNGLNNFKLENYSMNKYLFSSVINAYFKDEYEVCNTTLMYNTTDFIIRKEIIESKIKLKM